MKIDTPLCKLDVPENLVDKYSDKTDIELLEELVKQSNRTFDPVLVQILVDKELLFAGEKVSDIQSRINRFKQWSADEDFEDKNLLLKIFMVMDKEDR